MEISWRRASFRSHFQCETRVQRCRNRSDFFWNRFFCLRKKWENRIDCTNFSNFTKNSNGTRHPQRMRATATHFWMTSVIRLENQSFYNLRGSNDNHGLKKDKKTRECHSFFHRLVSEHYLLRALVFLPFYVRNTPFLVFFTLSPTNCSATGPTF